MVISDPRRPSRLCDSYTVTYDSSSHWKVLTQRWGSLWPQLFPYCAVNTLLMAMLHVFLMYGICLDVSSEGHNYLGFVVTFLLVSRLTTSLGRYNEARECLEAMNKSCRQLVHTMCAYTYTDTSEAAHAWRNEVAYLTCAFLRTAMAVIDYPSCGVRVADLPELRGFISKYLERVPDSPWLYDKNSNHYEDNLRIPIRISYLLRKSIRSHEVRMSPAISSSAEGDLYACLNNLTGGYYGLCKFLTTPTPFPLIQMTCTFLFFYLYTVPFALLSADDTSLFAAFAHCVVTFFLTYGFMGLELTSMIIDDPFGDKENDFNNLALAKMSFEDVYVTICDADGEAWAEKLQKQMMGSEDVTLVNEKSWLLQRSFNSL
jgi:predicted membrane chloride channel (bestrophin family)